jgi:hypothetical protein
VVAVVPQEAQVVEAAQVADQAVDQDIGDKTNRKNKN